MCLLQHVHAHNFEGFFPNVLPFCFPCRPWKQCGRCSSKWNPPISRTVNFRVNVGVFIRKKVFELWEIISQLSIIFFVNNQKVIDDLRNFWAEDIFSVYEEEILLRANMLIEVSWHAFFPERVNHFKLVLITQFSVQRKRIVKNKVLIVKIFLINSHVRNIW